MKGGKWEPYDPTWLVELADTVRDNQPDLAKAFRQCTRCIRESRAYIYFVDPSDPNQAGSQWQFAHNVLLESPHEGTIVVDVLADGRVGGIEFLKHL